MREIVRIAVDDPHAVHVQVVDNGAVIAEDIFPTPSSCHGFCERNLNSILDKKGKSRLAPQEISKIKELAPLPD